MGHRVLTILIAGVWLVNGLYCKVLNGVPRHQQIVAEILGEAHAGQLTVAIGLAEIGMALWVLSGRWVRLNTVVQIAVVLIMNLLEFLLVPDLLLWGRWNLFFALLFAALVYAHGKARAQYRTERR